MTKYTVTIRAKVTKAYTVDAVDEDAAMEQANAQFSILNDGTPEKYEQFVLNVEETT